MEKVSPLTKPVYSFPILRRYVVLTKEYLFTFREQGNYTAPTESIKMSQCSTVKSSDDEINMQ